MPWEFTEHHVRPNVFYWSPAAHKERQEVKSRRKEAAGHYKHAQACLRERNDPAAAEKLLELSVAAWPDNAAYLCALADCIAHQRQDPARALPWYDQLIDTADSPAHRMARARALATLGWLEQAITDMESALAADPQNGQYLKERGMAKQRMGLFFDATLDYNTCLPLLREAGLPTGEVLFNRGFCQRLLGNTEDALSDMEAALQLAPSVTAIKTVLGGMYMGKRRYKDALDLFQVVMTYKPHSAAAANNLALAQYLMATAEEHPPNKYGRVGKRQPGSNSTVTNSKATMQNRSTGRSGQEGSGSSGSDDDDGGDGALADKDAMMGRHGRANEDPRQWAISVVQAGARRASDNDPKQRALLDASLQNYNTAATLYMDDVPRMKAQAASDGEVHAVHENEPAAAVDGYLIILTNKVRIPGSPVVHDRELEDGEIQYNRGLVHLVLGNLSEAEAGFQDALAGNPTHAHYTHYRAVVHGRKGELREAVKCNQAALTLNPEYFPALYHQGLCLYLQSRNAEAIQRLDTALGLQPKNWLVMEARGRVLQELDRHAEALPALQDALHYMDADEPPASYARLHYAIAQSAIATHTPDLLRSSLNEARINGQDPASVYALKGLLAHREGRHHKALSYLGKAIRLAPQEARFLFDRSQVYLDLADWQAAIQDMSAALERLPDAASLHYSRGMTLLAMQEDERALQDLEAAATLVLSEASSQMNRRNSTPVEPQMSSFRKRDSTTSKNNPAKLHTVHAGGKGQAPAQSSQSQTSLSHLQLPPALVPVGHVPTKDTQSNNKNLPGQLRSTAGSQPAIHQAVVPQPRAARQAVVLEQGMRDENRGVLRPDPRLWEGTKFMTNAASPPDLTCSLWYHLGICRARQGAWPHAVTALERAVHCLPTHPALLHELAKAYQAVQKHKCAVEYFSRTVKLQPGNARALMRRGISYHAMRNYEMAAADLEAARRLDPDDLALRVDYRTLRLGVGAEVVGRPGEEAMVWDLQAFQPVPQTAVAPA